MAPSTTGASKNKVQKFHRLQSRKRRRVDEKQRNTTSYEGLKIMCTIPEPIDPKDWSITEIYRGIAIHYLSTDTEQGHKFGNFLERLADTVGLSHDFKQLGINYVSYVEGRAYIVWMGKYYYDLYHAEAEIIWAIEFDEDELAHSFSVHPTVIFWQRRPYSKYENLRSECTNRFQDQIIQRR